MSSVTVVWVDTEWSEWKPRTDARTMTQAISIGKGRH
jgi:hypothetical protein